MILKQNKEIFKDIAKDELETQIDYFKEEERFNENKDQEHLYLVFPSFKVNSLEYVYRYVLENDIWSEAEIIPGLINNYLLNPKYRDKYDFFFKKLGYKKDFSFLLAKQILGGRVSSIENKNFKVIGLDENGIKIKIIKTIYDKNKKEHLIDTIWNFSKDRKIILITAYKNEV